MPESTFVKVEKGDGEERYGLVALSWKHYNTQRTNECQGRHQLPQPAQAKEEREGEREREREERKGEEEKGREREGERKKTKRKKE